MENVAEKEEMLWRRGKVQISPYAFPSVPFFSLTALTAVPSGCLPSFRGGILSFIRSRPRASSKLRIFRVGEKPWMATGEEIKENNREGRVSLTFNAELNNHADE